MAKIDVYLRSIERFGAAGAILTSGQPITLRFPQGDRQATQVTPHDQLVVIVREIAPPAVLDAIDKSRQAKFEIESAGVRYAIDVTPKPGAWQVVLTSVGGAPAAAAAPASAPAAAAPRAPVRAATSPGVEDELPIERGQYADAGATTPRSASGSGLLDTWTTSARSARATDVLLAAGQPPMARVNGELQPIGDRGALDAETIARELGAIAPGEVRSAWTERGLATFTYGDGMGRVRATLTRDHAGPCVALRLLVGEPPQIERLGIGNVVGPWLDLRGLVLVAGPSGSGKTTTIAALVRSLAEHRRRVVTFEDSIELVHAGPGWVSQRAIGDHVPTVMAGVAAAMREGADAIVLAGMESSESAAAAVEAVRGGHLVVAAVTTTSASHALDRLVDRLPPEHRDLGRVTLENALLGTIMPVVKGAGRSFEVVARRDG